MKKFCLAVLATSVGIAVLGQTVQVVKRARPEWAFAVPDKDQPPNSESSGPQQIPGSDRAYTVKQIEDLGHPPDWFPNDHGPLPAAVSGEGISVRACGSCHLMSGEGHPESAGLAGIPVEYLERQMADFRTGARRDAGMTGISRSISEADADAAVQYFAALKPGSWVRVMESETVPKSYVTNPGRMRLPRAEGGTEPLGNRIVELPEDAHLAMSRDPHSGFVAYVPPGSVAKGKELVDTGGNGKTIACTICHGDELRGIGAVPRLAGLHPLYIARQLSMFQTDAYNGNSSALMKRVVSNLDVQDILELAAYLASLKP